MAKPREACISSPTPPVQLWFFQRRAIIVPLCLAQLLYFIYLSTSHTSALFIHYHNCEWHHSFCRVARVVKHNSHCRWSEAKAHLFFFINSSGLINCNSPRGGIHSASDWYLSGARQFAGRIYTYNWDAFLSVLLTTNIRCTCWVVPLLWLGIDRRWRQFHFKANSGNS